jgi:ankyrin repeat protein
MRFQLCRNFSAKKLAIHAASTWADEDVIDELLASGADINSRGENGETPIFRPIRSGNLDFMRFLLSRGADPWVKSDSGQSPIDVALEFGFQEIVEFLKTYSSVLR